MIGGAVAVCALVGTTLTSQFALAQEKKGEPAAKGQDDAAKKKAEADKKAAHEERMAAFRKLYPSAKTSLAVAIDAAEKKSKGKAYSATYGLSKDKKLTMTVEVTVGDKFMVVPVNPDTGVASDAKADEDDDDDEHEEHGN
jgi:hypothetical protein